MEKDNTINISEEEALELLRKRLLHLREKTDFFDTLFRSMGGYAIIAADFDGNVQTYNEEVIRFYGYKHEEMVGRKINIEVFFPKDFIESGKLQQTIESTMSHGTYLFEGENVRKDGSLFPAQIALTVVKAKDGTMYGFIVIVQDLTERKRWEGEIKALNETLERRVIERTAQINDTVKKLEAEILVRKRVEAEIRESNEKFIAISLSAQDAIIMIDDESNISFWNEAAERIFGYSRKEAVGNRVSELITPHRYRLAHIEGLRKFKETGKGTIIGKIIELEAVGKDGKEFPIELSVSALTLKGRWCAVGTIRDISKRVRREEELRLSYKMAALGQLTAGIFHEILNPINIISTHVQLLLADAEKGSDTEKDLKSIQEEIKRVQDITDGFLRFSRKESVAAATSGIDINQLIERVLAILVAEIKYKNIHLFKKFDHELPPVKASADSFRQVFLNLIRNAIDAMPNEGSLTISTMKCLKDEKPCLCIQISDTGCGIPKEHLSKIFDPFFTTKEEGKGVGMGLTIVYTIIQKSGGSISVSSEVGKGTTFTIELPLPEVGAVS